MVDDASKQALSMELTEVWQDYYTWVKVNTDLKTEEKRAEAATTMFIQHCRALEQVGYWGRLLNQPGFQRADQLPMEEKIIPDEHTHAKDAPETVPGDAFTEESLIGPAYDAVKKRWHHCPDCKKTDLEHVSGPSARHPGSVYQACFACRFYLNADGSKKDMGPRRATG